MNDWNTELRKQLGDPRATIASVKDGISPAHLANILSGRRSLTRTQIVKITQVFEKIHSSSHQSDKHRTVSSARNRIFKFYEDLLVAQFNELKNPGKSEEGTDGFIPAEALKRTKHIGSRSTILVSTSIPFEFNDLSFSKRMVMAAKKGEQFTYVFPKYPSNDESVQGWKEDIRDLLDITGALQLRQHFYAWRRLLAKRHEHLTEQIMDRITMCEVDDSDCSLFISPFVKYAFLPGDDEIDAEAWLEIVSDDVDGFLSLSFEAADELQNWLRRVLPSDHWIHNDKD